MRLRTTAVTGMLMTVMICALGIRAEDRCELYDSILSGSVTRAEDLDNLERWIALYPESFASFSAVFGWDICWHISGYAGTPDEARLRATTLERRALEPAPPETVSIRRLLVLANITEEVRKTNPRKHNLLSAFFDERTGLVKRRDRLLKELPSELPQEIRPLLNVLELKSKISDAVDDYLLDERMRPSVLLGRIESLFKEFRRNHGSSFEIVCCDFIRVHFLRLGLTLLISRTDPLLWIPSHYDVLREARLRACNGTGRHADICKHEMTFCADALSALLSDSRKFDPAEGVRMGETFLEKYSEVQPEVVARACVDTATCHWMQGNWDRAEELYKRALQLDPNNINARYRLQAMQSKRQEGITSGAYDIMRGGPPVTLPMYDPGMYIRQ